MYMCVVVIELEFMLSEDSRGGELPGMIGSDNGIVMNGIVKNGIVMNIIVMHGIVMNGIFINIQY